MSPVNKPKAHAKKSSKAYDFTVTGKKESIHLRGPKDNLSRNLEKAKNEGKSQSENWIG